MLGTAPRHRDCLAPRKSAVFVLCARACAARAYLLYTTKVLGGCAAPRSGAESPAQHGFGGPLGAHGTPPRCARGRRAQRRRRRALTICNSPRQMRGRPRLSPDTARTARPCARRAHCPSARAASCAAPREGRVIIARGGRTWKIAERRATKRTARARARGRGGSAAVVPTTAGTRRGHAVRSLARVRRHAVHCRALRASPAPCDGGRAVVAFVRL